jgi:hypothetical protein
MEIVCPGRPEVVDQKSGTGSWGPDVQGPNTPLKCGSIIHPHPKPEKNRTKKIKTSTFYRKQSLKHKFVLSELKI